MLRSVILALRRAWIPIVSMGVLYLVSVTVGVLMVNSGNIFAIETRDRVVSNAQSNQITIAFKSGNRVEAALLDFASNLFLGAVPQTLGGLGVIFPYPFAAYRGWIGGIVSIDNNHVSRLADPGKALYYITVLILQLIPYSLAGGAGVNLGLAYYRPRSYYVGHGWLGVPKEAWLDALRIYVLIVPLFLVASLVEFLT